MSIVPGRDVPAVPEEWTDAVNKAINDENHEDLCMCRTWPDACGSGHRPGQWDFGVSLDIAVGVLEPLIRARIAEEPQRLPAAWTDPVHGTVYDLTKPYLAEKETYFHHVGWVDLDSPVPLMGWSGSPDGRTASRTWEDINTLATLIADYGPLTPIEPTTEDNS